MGLHPSSILPGRVYSRSSNRCSTLYRRVINLGSRADCTSPLCLKPSKNGARGREEVWVRYETVIGGVMLVRSCSREAFARWAEKEEATEGFDRPVILFADQTAEQSTTPP